MPNTPPAPHCRATMLIRPASQDTGEESSHPRSGDSLLVVTTLLIDSCIVFWKASAGVVAVTA